MDLEGKTEDEDFPGRLLHQVIQELAKMLVRGRFCRFAEDKFLDEISRNLK